MFVSRELCGEKEYFHSFKFQVSGFELNITLTNWRNIHGNIQEIEEIECWKKARELTRLITNCRGKVILLRTLA